jgi:hypothetical protein
MDLNPGMSPDEVRKIVGDPREIINFGNKTTFRFLKFDVVFVDGKLVEVLFRDPGAKK